MSEPSAAPPTVGNEVGSQCPPASPVPVLRSPAARSAPRQRDQVVRRPSPVGDCLPPTTGLSKTERDPISTSGPSLFSMSPKFSMLPNQAIPSDKSIRFSPLAAARPWIIPWWPKALNASGSRPACRMAISRNAYFLIALLDYPEFAPAVRRGVHGTLYHLPGRVEPRDRQVNDANFTF